MPAGDGTKDGAGRGVDSGLDWHRSSHSGGGNDCVEVTFTAGGAGLRDSKDDAGAALWVTRSAWRGLRGATGRSRLAP